MVCAYCLFVGCCIGWLVGACVCARDECDAKHLIEAEIEDVRILAHCDMTLLVEKWLAVPD